MRQVFLPTRKFLVDGFAAFRLEGHVFHHHTVFLIGHACLDGIEPVKHVAFHHDELRHAVDHDGIFQCHQIHPAATTVASRYGTVFVSYFAERVACLVEQLYGERSRAYACAVCLKNTEHFADVRRTYAQSRAYASAGGIGRTDERIGAMVDVEHGALSTFGQHVLAFFQVTVDFDFRVCQMEAAQVFHALQPEFFFVRDVVVRIV